MSTTAIRRPRAASTVAARRAPTSRWASALLALLGADVGAVLALGLARLPMDLQVPGGLASWGGRTSGLLAEVLVLALVLLAARVPVLERAVGQDRLLRWHRWLAPAALVALVAHPLLLAAGYSGRYLPSLVLLGSSTLDAVAGTALFLVAAVVSVRIVRRRMPYEGWHLLHLTTYAAVVLAFLHQLGAGSQVLSGTLVRTWWLAQLVVVLAAAVICRVALPLLLSARHDLRVTAVTRESDDVVSVDVAGKDLDRLGARGGQFLVWRFLDRRHWWRAHPFSLSAAPNAQGLRLTAREVGDGTRELRHLRPGTRLLLEGPYGVLTDASRRTDRVLLVGAGLGIAPLRALLEDLPGHVDTVVLHRSSDRPGAVLHDEVRELAARRPATVVHLVTGSRGAPHDPDRPFGPRHLQALVPDLADREVFVCGPPALTREVLWAVSAAGVPHDLVHVESFQT